MLNIPIHWLTDYLDVDQSPEELADLLTRLGVPIEEVHAAPGGLGGAVLVAEVTPNRGDCLSMIGVAREVAAATGAELRLPGAELIESPDRRIDGQCRVSLEDPDLCPRYAARLVTGLRNQPSPEWMQQRLIACGQRAINVLVDITNFVLFEMGQPLHAFDHLLLGHTVVVRRAQAGEVIVTLDGVKRTLTGEQLLITDGERAVALAGVMGGANTEVSEHTTDVLLEAAHFHGPNIRRTARALGLESESSYRFARTVDPSLPVPALDRAAGLLASCAGGQVAAGVVDVVARPLEPVAIRLRPGRCNSFLGTAIPTAQIGRYLTALGLEVKPAGEDLQVRVPTRRPDLTREVDLIEEVARLHGYDEVPTTLPRAARSTGRLTPRQRLERRVRELLLGAGLNEVQTFSLTSPAAMARGGCGADLDRISAVRLANALNDEYSVLRWSMLPSLLEVLARNRTQHGEPLRIFEIGRTYAELDLDVTDEMAHRAGRVASGRTATTLPLPCTEELTLAGAVTGERFTSAWNLPAERLAADFYGLKGVLDLITAELRLRDVSVQRCSEPVFEPGRAARLACRDRIFAVLGEVAEGVRAAYDLDEPVLLFEANLGWLLDQADTSRLHRPLPRFPAALRDIAVVVTTEVPAADVSAAVRTAGGAVLQRVELFDVYQGQRVPEGTRSLAYKLTFRVPDRTLTDEEVDVAVERIVSVLAAEFDARLRE